MFRIDEIIIRNLLSFGEEPMTLTLNNLNVLIGPNGSGKSNFIEVINLLRSTTGDFQRMMAERGGITEWFRSNALKKSSASLDVKCSTDDANLAYLDFEQRLGLSFFYSKESKLLAIKDEISCLENGEEVFRCTREPLVDVHIYSRDADSTIPFGKLDWAKSILAQLQDPVNYAYLSYLADFYRSIRIYQEWHTGSASALRKPQRTDGQRKVMEEDFSNAALALNRVRQQPAEKKKLLEYFQLVYEGVEDVDVSIDGGWMSIVVHERGARIPAARLSDGTLRYLCLLLILLDPEPPSLICIEEPEICMHPDLISALAKLLVEASERTQLVVTTHSDILIDALTDHPESIVVCEKHDGATTMKRLDRDELATWLKDYTLGAMWKRGFLGGNRW